MADSFVGAKEIQIIYKAQANVFNIIDKTAVYFILSGSTIASRVIPKYAPNKPPNIARSILNTPILLAIFSSCDKYLYKLNI